MIHLCKRRFAAQPQFYCLGGIAAIANAGMVHRDIRMVGKGCTRMVQTRGARPGVSLLSAKRGEAIGKSWNSYRRDVLYARQENPSAGIAQCQRGGIRRASPKKAVFGLM